MNMQEAEECN